ncbi:MAG: hypothetical protein R3F49_03205 [Planctomycetota bacterium]
MQRTLSTLTFAALTLFVASCSAPSASVTPMIGSLKLDGSFGASDSGTAINSNFDELGIRDNEAAPGAKAQISFLGAQLSLSAFKTSYEGSGTTTGEVSIGSQTITAGAAVDTELDLTVARALFTWNLIPLGPVELGIGIGASLIDFDLLMQEQMTSNRLESNELIPIPMLALRAAWNWGPVKVRAEAGGLQVKVDGDEAKVIDGDLEASVRLFEGGSLLVGYRLLDINASYDDTGDSVDADLKLSGYYLGVRFAF